MADGFGAWPHYADCVRQTVLRTFSQWLLTAVAVFVLMEFAWQVHPGHWLTHRVMVAAIGAALLGKLSYSLEKAVLRRIRSRRQRSGA